MKTRVFQSRTPSWVEESLWHIQGTRSGCSSYTKSSSCPAKKPIAGVQRSSRFRHSTWVLVMFSESLEWQILAFWGYQHGDDDHVMIMTARMRKRRMLIVMMASREAQILITTPDPPTLGQPLAKWHDELRRTPHPTCLEQKYPGCGHKGTIGFGHKDTCEWKSKIVTVRNDWNTWGNVHQRTCSKGYRDWPLEIGYGFAQSTRLGNKTTRINKEHTTTRDTHSFKIRSARGFLMHSQGQGMNWVANVHGATFERRTLPPSLKMSSPLGIICYFSTWMCTPVIVWWITLNYHSFQGQLWNFARYVMSYPDYKRVNN